MKRFYKDYKILTVLLSAMILSVVGFGVQSSKDRARHQALSASVDEVMVQLEKNGFGDIHRYEGCGYGQAKYSPGPEQCGIGLYIEPDVFDIDQAQGFVDLFHSILTHELGQEGSYSADAFMSSARYTNMYSIEGYCGATSSYSEAKTNGAGKVTEGPYLRLGFGCKNTPWLKRLFNW